MSEWRNAIMRQVGDMRERMNGVEGDLIACVDAGRTLEDRTSNLHERLMRIETKIAEMEKKPRIIIP